MFGPRLRIEIDGFGVTLVPLKKDWMPIFSEGMSSLEINAYTMGLYGYPLETELEWYEKTRSSADTVSWAIVPDGNELPIGTTVITKIDIFGSCKTGIVILDKKWWRKGVGTRAHIIRTWYAADVLGRLTINTEVYEPNVASRKALEKVGYIVTGKYLREYRKGQFLDRLTLSWLNPFRIDLLYPQGLPLEYKESVEKARSTLETARKLITHP